VDGVVRQVREGLRLPHGARARGVVVVRLGSSARPLAPNRSEEARGEKTLKFIRTFVFTKCLLVGGRDVGQPRFC
jgi:hypothetical protein